MAEHEMPLLHMNIFKRKLPKVVHREINWLQVIYLVGNAYKYLLKSECIKSKNNNGLDINGL